MENDEITRRNTAIALYMGDKEYVWKAHYPDWMRDEADLLDVEDLMFHESWDWLMPVVEKVCRESDNGFHLIPASDGEWMVRFGLRSNSHRPTAIEVTWLAVSDYTLAQQKAV